MTYYVEITRAGTMAEFWRCGHAEPVAGALVMSGNVRRVPPEFSDGASAVKIIIPYGNFACARIDFRDDTVD